MQPLQSVAFVESVQDKFFIPKTVARTEDKIVWKNLSLGKACH
jgi:hypothetical protein